MRLCNSRRYQLLAFLFVWHVGALCAWAEGVPAVEDVNRLAESATRIIADFMRDSFYLRMRYEYYGRFETEGDREALLKLASKAADDLQQIARQQHELKEWIENYQGDDWEARFGSTGLWRKLAAQLYRTELAICEVRYCHALACEQPERSLPAAAGELLEQILTQIDSLKQSHQSSAAELIEARVLSLLARGDAAYRDSAISKLDKFNLHSDVVGPVTAQIERIKLTGEATGEQMESLLGALGQNRRAGDIEMIVSVMLLQRKYDANGFGKSVRKFAEAQEIIGNLILSDIQSKEAGQDLEDISVTDAELAAVAALTAGAVKYKDVLERLLSIDRFRTAAVVYAATVAISQSKPAEAVNLLIEASRLRGQDEDSVLGIPADEIAKQAAELGCRIFLADRSNCEPAVEAIESYRQMAGEKVDANMQYTQAEALDQCGQSEEAVQLLREIAETSGGYERDRTTLELLTIQLREAKQTAQQDLLLGQLREFILNCRGRDKEQRGLRCSAMNIYCEILLGREDANAAEDVLSVLGESLDAAEQTPGFTYDYFRALALQKSGRLEEAVERMSKAVMFDSGSMSPQVTALLGDVVERIEKWQNDAKDFEKMLVAGAELVEFADKLLKGRTTALLRAEIDMFGANTAESRLDEIDELLDGMVEQTDVRWLRCKARLLARQNQFEQAAATWAQIAQLRRNDVAGPGGRSWEWWRAKYYEIWCLSRSKDFARADICHLIDVLENSYSAIPDLWAKKLAALKKQCATP